MKEEKLPIYYQSEITALPRLEDLTNWQSINKDWYQQELSHPAYYALDIDVTWLRFRVMCALPAAYNQSYKQGDFKEGLWEMDIAELFLKDDASDAYQEFNLSPAGAWWSSVFSGYRETSKEHFAVPQNPQIVTAQDKEHWYASLTVRRSELAVSCSFSSASRGNVCFIFGQEPARTYLSAGTPDKGEPDYHRVEIFPTITSPSET